MRSKIQPGLALAAGVLVAAVLALTLMDRGDGRGSSPSPPPGAGSSVRLLPRGPGGAVGAGRRAAHDRRAGRGRGRSGTGAAGAGASPFVAASGSRDAGVVQYRAAGAGGPLLPPG